MASAWAPSSQSSSYPNVSFYENRIPAAPNDAFITDILTYWREDFVQLEENHVYIQWLFPNRDQGLNQSAFPLCSEEAKIIRETPKLKERVKSAFEMMLNFYGMRLIGDHQFELTKKSDERLRILNTKFNHNFHRITRILKSLLEFGYERLMLPWLKFLAVLIYKEKTLDQAQFSFEKYWLNTLDAEDKIALTSYFTTLLKSKPNNNTTYTTPSVTTAKTTSTTSANNNTTRTTPSVTTAKTTSTTTANNNTTRTTPSVTTAKTTSTTNANNTQAPTSSIKSSSIPKDFTNYSAVTSNIFNPAIPLAKTNNELQYKKLRTDKATPTKTSDTFPKKSSDVTHSGKKDPLVTQESPRYSKIIAFYKNEIPFEKNGDLIKNILRSWKGDTEKLMKNPYYIPWLFPTKFHGSVQSHVVITDAEAKIFRETPELKDRLFTAFEMMLDFYGMKLNSNNQFEMTNRTRLTKLDQLDNPHLKHITRILFALKNLGHKDLVLPWMKFLASVIYHTKYIPKAQSSFENHWMSSLDEKECRKISDFIPLKNKSR